MPCQLDFFLERFTTMIQKFPEKNCFLFLLDPQKEVEGFDFFKFNLNIIFKSSAHGGRNGLDNFHNFKSQKLNNWADYFNLEFLIQFQVTWYAKKVFGLKCSTFDGFGNFHLKIKKNRPFQLEIHVTWTFFIIEKNFKFLHKKNN